MIFWGQMQNYMMRINLSIIMVAMVNKTSNNNASEEIVNANHNQTFPLNTTNGNQCKVALDKEGSLEWSPELQGFVHASIGYGYFTTQIIGGRLA